MSATAPVRSVLPPDITARKGSAPLVVLTAYTTPMARLVDGHCDVALVGDSVGMVLHGLPSTLGVTMEMMILHGRAVTRGLQRAMAVIDMPFGSYEESPAQAFANAQKDARPWNVVAQQTIFGRRDYKIGAGRSLWNDGWDGYSAARTRLTDALQKQALDEIGGFIRQH